MSGGGLKRKGCVDRDSINLRELNPNDREFIHADPPCSSAERRFVAGFGVDANKRLTLSLKDLKDGNGNGNGSYIQTSSGEKVALPVKDFPVVKL